MRKFRARFWRRLENVKRHLQLNYGITELYKHILIFDVSGFSMGHLKGTRRHLIQKVIGELSDLYPEVIYRLYLVNSPFFFRAAWSIISTFIDPVTVTKIKVMGSDFLPTLLKDIDISMIPKQYGGHGTWELRPGMTPKDYPIKDEIVDPFINHHKSKIQENSSTSSFQNIERNEGSTENEPAKANHS